jgi:hypothetical protein
MPQLPKIGLIVGVETDFPAALLEEVNGREAGVVAELVRVGTPRMSDEVAYAVIIDRTSHEVPFYRTYLKHAALQGCRVVNNPFVWSADDKFFGATLAERLGIASPRTVLLPHKEYVPGMVHDRALRNLEYPLDWQGVIDHVGLPCILKDAHGGGWRDVHLCESLEELLFHYNESGQLLMIAQEYIRWDGFFRCLCLGREEVLPMAYDPREHRYLPAETPIEPTLRERLIEESRRLMRALGYDMNTIEWAVRDGTPYAIDLMNPAPDAESLPPAHFRWAVATMADVAIRFAREAVGDRTVAGGRWSPAMGGERITGQADLDGAGDLAEELPNLARDLPRREG